MYDDPVTPTRRHFLVAVLVIWAAAFLAYSNSFTIGFQFDDTHTVQSNIYVRSLKYVPRYFIDPDTSSYRPENSGYRPMTTLFLALGFQLSHVEPWGYHLMKLIEHCIVATLILTVGLKILPRGGMSDPFRFLAAAFAGLVFAVHRVNTEVVDYISAVSTLQAGMFFLLAFYLYLRWRESRVRWYYAASAACFLFSMWSKEEGITLPAVLFAYEWIYGRATEERYGSRLWRHAWSWIKTLVPFAALAVAFVATRQYLMLDVAHSSRGNTSTYIYFITQFRSWLHYAYLYFWPVHLNADNLSFDFSPSLGDWRIWVSLTVHATVWFAAYRLRYTYRFVSFGAFWLYVTVLPASSVFNLVEAVNEHRSYIPYMMLSLLSAWLVFLAASRFRLRPAGVSAALLGICVALGAGAYERNKVWQTDISLWEDVHAKNPNSVRAMNVLGISLLNRGNVDRARPMLERCHELMPQYLPCIVHLSMAYAMTKEFDRGLAVLKTGHAMDPNYVHINFHLGVYYKDYFADYESAREYFTRVERLSSGRFFHATVKRAEIALEEGRADEAQKIAGTVLELDQTNGDAWEVVGKVALVKKDYEAALRVFRKLSSSAPAMERYLLNVANAEERKGDAAQAAEAYRRSVELNPLAIQGWMGLVRVAARLGDGETAVNAQGRVEELRRTRRWVWMPSMFFTGENPRQTGPG